MKKLFILLTITFGLSGCVQMDKNQAVADLQIKTMNALNLASSDELTISEVIFSEPNAMGQEKVNYTVTTAKGRVLECNTTLMPSVIITTPPTLLDPTCKPKEASYTVQ